MTADGYYIDGAESGGPKPETLFWRNVVRPKLSHFGVLHRIENVMELGTPDVAACLHRGDRIGVSSWIELKHAHKWTVRSLFRFKHFTVDQADWLEEWGRIGRACVLAQVADEFLLVPSAHARELQRGVTRARFYEMSAVRSEGGKFPTGRVVQWLTAKT